MGAKRVAFMDLRAMIAEQKPAIDAAIAEVLRHGQFIKGPELGRFECDWAGYCGVRFAVGASNGTSALHVALHAAGIGPGDEVIIPSHTFMATVESVRHCGAKPVFADIDDGSMILDPAAAEAAITPRTRAIVVVQIYGCPGEMDRLRDICARRGLVLIEDAAQSHGARYRGARSGSLGDAAAFSFFPGKNLGAFGDAGAVTTDNEGIHRIASKYVDHGRDSKYTHSMDGTNYRLDTIQAAILGVRMQRLDAWNAARRATAARYIELLSQEPFASLDVRWQVPPEGAEPVYHIFCARVPARDRVLKELEARGIGVGIHYPVPCHLQKAAIDLGTREGQLPVTERVAGEIVSLPMHPHMTAADVEVVCSELKDILTNGAAGAP